MISANGEAGNNAGAGGGIHLAVSTFSGSGQIRANGGTSSTTSTSYSSGGGGRVSIYSDDRSGFSGSVQARGGARGSNIAGAGTVYFKDASQAHGELHIDNGGSVASLHSTPIRHIDRHIIEDVFDLGSNRWEVTVQTQNAWIPTNTALGHGVQGLQVDLDSADDSRRTYTIVSNTANSLVVETTDDLSAFVGKELVGVHIFNTLRVANGASVDIGQDVVRLPDGLTVDGSQGETLPGFDNNGTLEIDGDLSLVNGAVLRVPNAGATNIYGVHLQVGGTLTIDSTSSINLDGKGNQQGRFRPDFSTEEQYHGCHGGRSDYNGYTGGSNAACVYGDYTEAQFAGSGASNLRGGNSKGGGQVRIEASSLVVDGLISANGEAGNNAGAGGGIHLAVSTLSGSGQIRANGGTSSTTSTSYSSGGGGRVSIYSDDRSGFTGSVQARGGARGSNIAGAGTVYFKDTSQTHGELHIDNGGPVASLHSTPLRHIDRHIIEDVVDLGSGRWEVIVQTLEAWSPTNLTLGHGIQGLQVDLDSDDDSSPLYRVLSNTEYSFIVETNDYLINEIGNELVGVHTFDTLRVANGASVDFGQDVIRLPDGLIIDGSRGETLPGFVLEIDGDLSLVNGAVLTVPNAGATNIYGVHLQVGGTLTIDSTSAINLDGKGNRQGRFRPDFSTEEQYHGCHGGRSDYNGYTGGSNAACVYGDYTEAQFAGSGASNLRGGNSKGGGQVRIEASSLVVDGLISANGEAGNNAGAGGGIHLAVSTLSGSGQIRANGGTSSTTSTSYSSGGGGRVSIYSDDRSGFTGSVQARGGARGSNIAGAGTVYFKDTSQDYGHLRIDNLNNSASTNSTPIKQIGRHFINTVESLGNDEWQISITTDAWAPSIDGIGQDIQSLRVDLDASENTSQHYSIESNTANSFVIRTSDDLSTLVGNELVGVHEFETLTVSNGAFADFGEDRVTVYDLDNSSVDLTRVTASRDSVMDASQVPPTDLDNEGSLLSGIHLYLTAIAPGGSTAFEDRLTEEYLGDNAANAVTINLRELNSWNRYDNLFISPFDTNTVFNINVASMCWMGDDAYLTIAFYNDSNVFLGEFRYSEVPNTTWRGQVQFETPAGDVTTLTPQYGTYSGRINGTLSFTNGDIIFQHGSASYGIDNFTFDTDLTTATYVSVSAGVYATYSGGTCGAAARLGVQ